MLTRNFLLILLANVILGSAMPMLIILGVLAGTWLAPQAWLATAPPSAQMLAGILVASPISLFMGRFGRRAGFLLGAVGLVLGAGLAVWALQLKSFALLCAAHALLGAVLVCLNYFRFAAAEAVDEAQRPRAISFTLASGLIAALIGPELFSYSKDALVFTPLAGAYAAMAGLGLLGAIPVLGLRMPRLQMPVDKPKAADVWPLLKRHPKVLIAIGIAALSQAMMVLLMTPTPLAMVGCGFGEDQAADVIRWHVVAMFAPGFFTGSLIQRFGAERIAALGGLLLLLAALVAVMGLQSVHFYSSLILLGVGWNFGFISGTQLLQSSLSEAERPLIQGLNDTILAIAATVASLLSGVLYASVGWLGLAALATPVLLILGLMLYVKSRRSRTQLAY